MTPKRVKRQLSTMPALRKALEVYVENAVRHAASIDEEADADAANSAARAIARARARIMRAGDEGRRLLLSLLRHRHPAVRVWAAADSLAFAPSRALPVLRRLQSMPGTVGLDAMGVLYEWQRGATRRGKV